MPVHLLRYLMFDTRAECCRTIRPAEDLRAVIDSFVAVSSRDARGQKLVLSDGLPSMVVAFSGAGEQFTEDASFVGAWLTSPVLRGVYMEYPAPDTCFIVVRFNIENFHRLVGIPLKALRGRATWRLPEVFGVGATAFENALKLPGSLGSRLACMEDFFRSMPFRASRPDPVVRAALEEISRSGGCISIRALSRALGVNYKFLERGFIMRLGVAPKEYARFQRFIRTYFSLVRTRGSDVLGTALEGGYYDQNHFAKEFKWFTGKSPLSYLRTPNLA